MDSWIQKISVEGAGLGGRAEKFSWYIPINNQWAGGQRDREREKEKTWSSKMPVFCLQWLLLSNQQPNPKLVGFIVPYFFTVLRNFSQVPPFSFAIVSQVTGWSQAHWLFGYCVQTFIVMYVNCESMERWGMSTNLKLSNCCRNSKSSYSLWSMMCFYSCSD